MNTKRIAASAVAAALMVAVQYALSFVEGIELVTVFFVAFCYTFGVRCGTLAGTAFSLLRCLLFGFSPPVVIVYLVYYALVAACFGLAGKRKIPTLLAAGLLVLLAAGSAAGAAVGLPVSAVSRPRIAAMMWALFGVSLFLLAAEVAALVFAKAAPVREAAGAAALACFFTVFFTLLDDAVTPLFYGYSRGAAEAYFFAGFFAMLPQTLCAAVSVFFLFRPLKAIFSRSAERMRLGRRMRKEIFPRPPEEIDGSGADMVRYIQEFEEAKTMEKFDGDWIWPERGGGDDEYAEFCFSADAEEGEAEFAIACDGMFELYVNGECAGWGKYPDFPHDRVLDRRTVRLAKGKNDVALRVWHIGKPCFTYRPGTAGAAFALVQGGKTLYRSSAATRGRISPSYENHRLIDITSQLGIGYRYDATGEDGWTRGKYAKGAEPGPCRVTVSPAPALRPRPIKLLEEGAPVGGRIVQQGTFVADGEGTAAVRMQHAGLFFAHPWEIAAAGEGFGSADDYARGGAVRFRADISRRDGIYLTIDLGREDVGFPDLDFSVSEECDVWIGYGEHLADGRPRTAVGPRNFALEYRAVKGDNRFVGRFRRMGLRYLTVFFFTNEVVVRRLGVRPVFYPTVRIERTFRDPLHQKMWDVSVRTLELCMHDHYEDTPWREQSLYAMDSRNQMLFGYIAFRGTEFARASLELLAGGRRDDRLLALTSPSGSDYPIPYFSLMYLVETAEYCEFSGDYAFGEKVWDTMKGILDVFVEKIAPNGLVANFTDPTYWNFYEWTDGLSGEGKIGNEPSFDAPLNAFFLLALDRFLGLSEKIGKAGECGALRRAGETVRKSADEAFFDESRGLYVTYLGKLAGHFAELTNALCVVSGIAGGARAAKIAAALAAGDNGMVPISVSMSVFKYDALLLANEKKYAPVVLRDVETAFSKMLYEGATSFWETANGEADFEHAGSLSHGWSAIPVYLFDRLNVK